MLAHARTIALVAALGAGSPLVARAEDPQADADALFRSAADHYAQRDWQAAGDDFARLLELAPEHKWAQQTRFHYGEALVQLRRYEEARRQFDELLARQPDDRFARQALFRSGEASFLAGDRQAARRQLQAFGKQYPDDPLNAFALAHLGKIELDDGHAQAAAEVLAAAVEQFPKSPLADQCRWHLAEAQSRLKQTAAARASYQKLAEARGDYAEYALLRLAAIDNERGDHAGSLAWLDRMAKEHPHGALADKATLGRGYALYKLGRSAEAEAALAPLREHPRLAVDAHYWLGMSQFGRGAWKEAATTFLAGAAIDPKHRWNETLTYQAACALLNDEQYDAASEEFDRVLQRWPQTAWGAACLMGKLQASAGRDQHAEVIQLADELAARYPHSKFLAEAQAAKGRALAAQGQHAAAANALEKSLGAKTGAVPAIKTSATGHRRAATQHELAVAYAELGRFADARRLIAAWYEGPDRKLPANDAVCYRVAEMAFAADDLDNAEKLFDLLAARSESSDAQRRGLLGKAWCRYKAEDWHAAADTFGTLLEKFPGAKPAPEAALLRGRALEHLQDTSGALAMYRRVMDRHPGNARAAEAIYRAAALHERLGETTSAARMYARLVKEHSDFERLDAALYHWARLIRETDPAKAEKLDLRLRAAYPGSEFAPDATLQLAQQAFDDKRYDTAKELLVSLLGGDPPAAVRHQALYLAGRLAAAEQRWEDVETSLARLIDEAPDSEFALAATYLRAESSYRRARYAESAERLSVLAADAQSRKQPWSAAAQLRQAHAHVQLRQWHEALEVARALAAEYPDFEKQYEVDYVIGRCLAAQADFVGAREAYSRVLSSRRAAGSETAALAQWMIGETYFHQEDYAAALVEYEKAERQFPAARIRAAALLQAGKCHERLGHWDAAVATYRRMIEECPESELASEASRRVAAAEARVAQRSQEAK